MSEVIFVCVTSVTLPKDTQKICDHKEEDSLHSIPWKNVVENTTNIENQTE